MNKRFAIAWFVVFVVWMACDFVVHGMLLHADYGQLPNLFRTEAESQQFFPLLILAHVIAAGAFCWIYARGLDPRPWLPQGIRFGLVLNLMTTVPSYLIYYVVQPMPRDLVVKQIVFEGVVIFLLGIVVAFLYRGQRRVTVDA